MPEKTLDNYEQLKCIRLSQFKENLVGFIDGHDACSKLTVLNFRTNQVSYNNTKQKKLKKEIISFDFFLIYINKKRKKLQTVYQSKNLKLLNSFSFHSIVPLVAIANEQQVTIAKIN